MHGEYPTVASRIVQFIYCRKSERSGEYPTVTSHVAQLIYCQKAGRSALKSPLWGVVIR